MKKKIIIGSIIVIFVIILIQIFSGGPKEEKNLFVVEKGTVSVKIAETGQVKKGDKVNLSFKNSGEVSRVYVKAGDTVLKGDLLMKLNTDDLSLRLQEAQASLALAETDLDKLLAGPTEAEIKIYQTSVNNREIALSVAEESLSGANENALNTSDSAYLYSYNAHLKVDNMLKEYFDVPDQSGLIVREKESVIENSVEAIKTLKNSVGLNSKQEEIDLVLSGVRENLIKISFALASVRETAESPSYKNVVSDVDKTSLDTHRANINSVVSALASNQQAIDSAELAIMTAKGNWQAAKDDLAFLLADPRQEDVNLYEKRIVQAQAQVSLINNQIQDSHLRSSVNGQIAEVFKKEGELAQASFQDTAIVILPDSDFQIEVNVYEEDIVNVKAEDYVEIELVAFPNEIFKGSVVSIDPAENIVEGVVYYKVLVTFNEAPLGMKSGMTADIVIMPEIRQDVLYVPQEAISNIEDKTVVKIYKDGEEIEREIEIGLKGEDYIEVISGLTEGEEVILD